MGKIKFKKDALGTRMKEFYENRTRFSLPRRTYTIIRIDGKAFHTYTKGLVKPFDAGLIEDMDNTACYLCEKIQGAKMAFVQSDEISILLTDFDKLTTDAWFDGNIQKIVSVSASMATAKFNQLRIIRKLNQPNLFGNIPFTITIIEKLKLAEFDSRTFIIPTLVEVENYFIWRQQDTVRNSISSVAQSLFSTEELKNINTKEQKEMCFIKGVDWNDYSIKEKRGRLILKTTYLKNDVERSIWESVDSPNFTEDRSIFKLLTEPEES